jgi:formylmethanofuran dehydrogenase subunit E
MIFGRSPEWYEYGEDVPEKPLPVCERCGETIHEEDYWEIEDHDYCDRCAKILFLRSAY